MYQRNRGKDSQAKGQAVVFSPSLGLPENFISSQGDTTRFKLLAGKVIFEYLSQVLYAGWVNFQKYKMSKVVMKTSNCFL